MREVLPGGKVVSVEIMAKKKGCMLCDLALMRETGFQDAEEVGRTGFDSSPLTKGTLFRAVKGNPMGLRSPRISRKSFGA